MLLEDRFELPDFVAEPLAFSKGAFQSGSKIALILHEGTRATAALGQESSGLITENPSSPATSQSIASAATK
jgi:hypothetical protein